MASMSLKKKMRPNSLIASNFQAPTAPDFQTPIIYSQFRVLNKDFVIDMVALFDEFKFAKPKKKENLIMLLLNRKKKIVLKEMERKNAPTTKTYFVF